MSARIEERPASAATLAGFVRTGRAYVLFADDDATEGVAFRDALMENHFSCDVVHNADDVLSAFAVRDYDLILLNLRMGQAESHAAARKVRDKERHFPEPRVPIVMFSGGATPSEKEKAAEAGIDDVVVRPKDKEALAELLSQLISFDRRTPPSLIPREPIHYPALLALCAKDEARARAALEGFAAVLKEQMELLRTAMTQEQAADAARVGETLRQAASQVASGRVQRTAFVLTKVASARQLKDQGRDSLEELERASRDLAVWMRLQLGQSFMRSRPRIVPIKSHMIKLSSFLKKRLDVFAKAP